MKEQFKTIHGNEIETPQWLFDRLNAEFNFIVDLACTQENKKAPSGISIPEFNSLAEDWHKWSNGYMWLNPPYSPLKPWIQKAQKEFLLGAKIVMLVPPIISTRYFSEVTPSEIRFILGRISFIKNGIEMKSNTSDSMIVIFDKPRITKITYIERELLRKPK